MRIVVFLSCLTALGGPLPLKKLPTDPQTLVSWLASADSARREAAYALFKVPTEWGRPRHVALMYLQLDTDPEYEAAISLRNMGTAMIMDKRGTSWFGTVIDVGEPGLGGDLRLSSRQLTNKQHEDILGVTEGHSETGTAVSLRIIVLRPDGFHIAHHAVLYDVEWDDFAGTETEQLGKVEMRPHLNRLVLLDRFGNKKCAAFAWNPAIVKFVPNADATRALCKP